MTSRLIQPLGRIAGAACAVAGGLGLAVLATSSPASAAPTPMCTGANCTITFASAGVGQTWVVPAGVTRANFQLYGGAGAGVASVRGGDGAEVTGTLGLAAGTDVTVDVGGGSAFGEFGGANGGGNGSASGGSGGGASDIKLAGVAQLIAGGGGGAGSDSIRGPALPPAGPNPCAANIVEGGAGGNADSAGQPGLDQTLEPGGTPVTLPGGAGGHAGTPSGDSAGGLAGTPSASSVVCAGPRTISTFGGNQGVNGTAGQGGQLVTGGGGGGGGLFGGGQGALGASDAAGDIGSYGGGGGGSSFGTAGSNFVLVSDSGNDGDLNDFNGEVIITYTVGAVTPITTPATTPGGAAGTTPATAGATGATAASGSLAFTGVDIIPLLGVGGGLLAGGLLLVSTTSNVRRKRMVSDS
jgi:hypothetical protein